MAKKAAPKPQHVEPENESQEIPEEQSKLGATPPELPAKGRAVNQADLIKQAMAAGHEKPSDGVDYIKRQFGVEVDPKYYSVAKSQQRKREAKQSGEPKATRGRKPKAASAPAAQPVRAVKPEANGEHFSGGMISDLTAIKALVERLGVAEVKQIAELFG